MQPIKIEIELPEEIARYVDHKDTDYHRKAREILLYQLVKDGKISFGKAAEILGMRKIDFITQLGRREYLNLMEIWTKYPRISEKYEQTFRRTRGMIVSNTTTVIF